MIKQGNTGFFIHEFIICLVISHLIIVEMMWEFVSVITTRIDLSKCMVEIFFSQCDDSLYMLQFINLTRFNGMTFFEPLEVRDISVKFEMFRPKKVKKCV